MINQKPGCFGSPALYIASFMYLESGYFRFLLESTQIRNALKP